MTTTSPYATIAYVDEKFDRISGELHGLKQSFTGLEFMMSRVLQRQPIIEMYLEHVLIGQGDLERALNEQGAVLEQHSTVLEQHSSVLGRHTALLEQHTARLDGIDGRLDGIDGQLQNVDSRLEKVDGQLQNVDGRLEKVDGQLQDVDGRLGRLESGQVRTGELLEQILERLPAKPIG